jgi:hypothetical protein
MAPDKLPRGMHIAGLIVFVGWAAASTDMCRRRMAGGDRGFTEDRIRASEEVLVAFLDSIEAADGDAKRQRAAFEVAAKAFDRLNVERGGFIETGEREDLGEFFNRIADHLGIPYEDGDITWEWRKAW